MTQHKVVNAGWRRIERLSSELDHAGLNVTPPDPDQAGLNAKGLNRNAIRETRQLRFTEAQMPAYTLHNWRITALTKIYKSKTHYGNTFTKTCNFTTSQSYYASP